jgi:hypothetical protein
VRLTPVPVPGSPQSAYTEALAQHSGSTLTLESYSSTSLPQVPVIQPCPDTPYGSGLFREDGFVLVRSAFREHGPSRSESSRGLLEDLWNHRGTTITL